MSVAKNFIYNVIYQVFVLITPLITVPYISRVLGSNGVGINAYTNSIIQYFILFGTIGISMYGNRSVAYVRDNRDQLSKTFWGIMALKILTAALSYSAFLVFLLFIDRFQVIFLIQSIYIISAAVDITWLFMGLENFKKIVLRNIVVKFIGIASIFVFVQTSDDLWKYVLALSLTELLGQLTMYIHLSDSVNRVKIRWRDIKKHFMPAMTLFLPQVAIQIYAVLNKTMLGTLSTTNEVGFFDNADKIIKMILAVVTATGVVMLPRVSNTFAMGHTEKVKDYLTKSLDFATYMAMPMMFGIIGIAQGFTPWFFGPGFSTTGQLICIIGPIILFIAWSNVLGVQYLMPLNRMRPFTLSVTVGAIVNFIFNLILIPNFQSAGTAISTVIAEFAVTGVQLLFVWRDIQLKRIVASLWKYLVASVVMFLLIWFIGNHLPVGIGSTLFQVAAGSVVYFLLLFLLKSRTNLKVFTFVVESAKKIFSKGSR
ncbi:flippase [Sporolactobacillus sp. THM19-2]|uniref:flippase n=1 Tax=Sporolactobacillus sp. THM19-2 TaxID=2511171 RepID=UPI00101FA226|nr:flippase [Sporolactobacillus sp. THM19-2]RYL93952.1 flippase [Sporolactobacillus sp. THM19-2]